MPWEPSKKGRWAELEDMCAPMLSRFSRVWLCVTIRTVASQAPLSMRFSENVQDMPTTTHCTFQARREGTADTLQVKNEATCGWFLTKEKSIGKFYQIGPSNRNQYGNSFWKRNTNPYTCQLLYTEARLQKAVWCLNSQCSSRHSVHYLKFHRNSQNFTER